MKKLYGKTWDGIHWANDEGRDDKKLRRNEETG
jgi:hypothetical protein